MASLIHSSALANLSNSQLWLVGNGLSDTLELVTAGVAAQLWLVGNGLSDTLYQDRECGGRVALAGWEWPL